MTSQLSRFRCLFLSCQQQKNTENGAAVTSLRSFLFRDDFTYMVISNEGPKKVLGKNFLIPYLSILVKSKTADLSRFPALCLLIYLHEWSLTKDDASIFDPPISEFVLDHSTMSTVAVWTQNPFTLLLTRPKGSQGCQKSRILFYK